METVADELQRLRDVTDVLMNIHTRKTLDNYNFDLLHIIDALINLHKEAFNHLLAEV